MGVTMDAISCSPKARRELQFHPNRVRLTTCSLLMLDAATGRIESLA